MTDVTGKGNKSNDATAADYDGAGGVRGEERLSPLDLTGAMYEDFAKAQAAFSPLRFNKKATIKHKRKDGSFAEVTYAYADLAAIREATLPSLNKNGFAFTQPITVDHLTSDVPMITAHTRLLHKSGLRIEGLPVTMTAADSKPHAIGSAITYARRYSASATLSLAADEDDDGHAAQGVESEDAPPRGNKRRGARNQAPGPKGPLKDAEGNERYYFDTDKLNDEYQGEHGLYSSANFYAMRDAIRASGISMPDFELWVKATYDVHWFDVKTEMYAGVMSTISKSPDEIRNFSRTARGTS